MCSAHEQSIEPPSGWRRDLRRRRDARWVWQDGTMFKVSAQVPKRHSPQDFRLRRGGIESASVNVRHLTLVGRSNSKDKGTIAMAYCPGSGASCSFRR